MKKTDRLTFIDALRGFALLNMIFYHALWDLVYLYHAELPWFRSAVGAAWQFGICSLFIVVSGFCWPLGTQKVKRALLVLLGALAVFAVTVVMMPKEFIAFGVLTFIGSAMLLMLPIDRGLKKLHPLIGLIVSLCLFVLFKNINSGALGVFGIEFLKLPESWYANGFTAYLGFPPKEFLSVDYFSLFPWFFLYLSGYFLYGLLNRKNGLKYLKGPRLKFLEWLGRNSLLVYLLHQPIIFGLLWLIYK